MMSSNNRLFLQLENEKAARMNAEENAATLVRQRELDEKKMRELEAIRTQLEELLDEERQAKKDEEIVRTLQVRQTQTEWRITQPSYPICSENEDTPSNCTLYVFFFRIFIKNDLEGFITKQKISKSHGFMQVR